LSWGINDIIFVNEIIIKKDWLTALGFFAIGKPQLGGKFFPAPTVFRTAGAP
jgi:hypothetical protein